MGSKPSYSASPRGDPGQWMFLQVPILDWFREPNSGAGAGLWFDRWGLWSSTQQEVSRIQFSNIAKFMPFHAFSTSFCWAYYLLRPSEKFTAGDKSGFPRCMMLPDSSMTHAHLFSVVLYNIINGHFRNLNWRYRPYIIHFRILKFPLI